MGGSLFPPLDEASSAQVLHRWIAVVVGLIVAAVVLVAWRTQRANPPVFRLALLGGVLYPIQAVIGGLQVLTHLSSWSQTLHVALGAMIWAPRRRSRSGLLRPARRCRPRGAGRRRRDAERRRRRRSPRGRAARPFARMSR